MYLRNDKHENLLLGRKHKDSFIHKSDKIIVVVDNQFELSPSFFMISLFLISIKKYKTRVLQKQV
jgi:hypothetical protein